MEFRNNKYFKSDAGGFKEVIFSVSGNVFTHILNSSLAFMSSENS